MPKTGISKFPWIVVPTRRQLPRSADPGQPAFVTSTGRMYHYTNNAWEQFYEGGSIVAPHAGTHNHGGTDVLATDALVGRGSFRTIGNGPRQAAAGNHTHVLLFEKGGSLLQTAGITATGNYMLWRAQYACTVLDVWAMRVGGGANISTVNARRNGGGAGNHCGAGGLQLVLADTWYEQGAITDPNYAVNDYLEWMIQVVAGAPTFILVQVNFSRNI